MYNIENSTVNHSVRAWEWDRFDDECEAADELDFDIEEEEEDA